MTINKNELKYILYATMFAFVVFIFVIPNLIERGIENSNPYLQFLMFYVSIFIFFQFFLKAKANGGGIKIKGALGVISLFMALDILVPPLLVSPSGELLSGVVLSASAADYIFGVFYSSLGITGFLLYLSVYIMTPFILLYLSSKLLPNFVNAL